MTAVTEVANFFDVHGPLPVFTGNPETDALPTWQGLNKTDRAVQWCKAAIAASLVRAWGQRTDCGAALTPIQSFCKEGGIGVEHCARMAKTHRVFSELLTAPLDPGIKRLVQGLMADHRLSFKHFLIVANHCAADPVKALLEARDNGLSAGTMLYYIAARKKKLRLLLEADGQAATHRTYDDDPDITVQLPTPDETAASTSARVELAHRRRVLQLTDEQQRTFDFQVAALALAYGTEQLTDTVAMAVASAFERLKQQDGEPA